jgi:hypothetical protein
VDLVALAPGLLRLIDREQIAELERTLGARVPGGWTEAIPASLTAPSPPRRGSRPAGRASGTLRFQLAELAGLSSAAVVVEER